MVTTVSQSTSAILLSFTANAPLANAVAALAAITLVLLLISREMVGHGSVAWLQRYRQGIAIAVYPIGFVFLAIILAQAFHT